MYKYAYMFLCIHIHVCTYISFRTPVAAPGTPEQEATEIRLVLLQEKSRRLDKCYCRRLGMTRLDSIRFDSIRFDSIRFDSIRFDSIRFDSIRLHQEAS